MAHFQNQYNAPSSQRDYDEYGNPVVRTVDSGAPLTGHTLGAHHEGAGGVLRRSGSSSSSSSEDDGQGGRRKKGIKEKIKEKIPGVGHRHDDRVQASYGTTAGYGIGNEQPHEKKGVMDKIKEKLPGHKHKI